MIFEITPEQLVKIKQWSKTLYPPIVEEQMKGEYAFLIFTDDEGITHPYFGACGGEITYEITPTSIGDVVKAVFCKGTKWESSLDITNYDLF